MPPIPAVHHVAMSVRDLSVSEPFYSKLFGAEPAMTLSDGPFRRRVFALADGQLFGLTQHDGVSSDDRFDPARVGLDHVGFGCADSDAVTAWREHLDSVGIEHSGIVEADYGLALSVKDPDGNALEFFMLAG
ncbi:VOC family protein [Actinomycetospora corticicola]|uniref:Catechol-2,3-dioxygenase n=1 Tax=Actinomycetospora corticicola TaxID=663602 RepID=A0A7Y9E123_9PSEU|nr:VOC family protein [Actinomycetospora corticicola]NYD38975.1 catechol-2,3-dioxygenase [Actinomycetospora corticicola]